MYPIVIQGEIGERELLALNRVVYRSRRLVLTVLYAVLLGLLLLSQAALFALTGRVEGFAIAVTAAALLILLYEAFFLPLIIKSLVRKQLARLGVKQTVVELYEDCLIEHSTCQSGAADERINYTALIGVTETETYFFLFLTKLSAVVLDKGRMNGDQLLAVRDLLARRIPAGQYKIR